MKWLSFLLMVAIGAPAAEAQLFRDLGDGARSAPPTVPAAPVDVDADALSAPGALQAYLDKGFADKQGLIRLPRGVIRYSEPLLISRRDGGVITGAGACGHRDIPEADQVGWRDPKVRRGTLLHYTGPTESAALTIRDSHHLVLQDLSIQAPGGTGLSFESGGGWGNNNHTLERVGFLGSRFGVETGRAGKPFNSADISFQTCDFRHCEVAFRAHADQNVCYWFTDGCYWYSCDRAIDMLRGGNVSVRDAGVNGSMTAFLTIRGSGANNALSRIDFLRIDRSGGGLDDRVRVVDVSDVQGAARVLVDGVQVTRIAGDSWDGWKLFVTPTGERAKDWIDVRSVLAPPGADTTPGPASSPLPDSGQ